MLNTVEVILCRSYNGGHNGDHIVEVLAVLLSARVSFSSFALIAC
jgi:hypothetical protein